MGDEARTTQCLDWGQKTRLKKLTEEKKTKPPLIHNTHHLHSLAKFLLQSYTMLSMAASAELPRKQVYRCVCRRHRVYWFKAHIFICLEAIR